MKRLFFCGLFLFALTFAAFFFGHVELFVYWSGVIGTSTLIGTLLGSTFGEIDIREENAPVRVPVPVTSKQF